MRMSKTKSAIRHNSVSLRSWITYVQLQEDGTKCQWESSLIHTSTIINYEIRLNKHAQCFDFSTKHDGTQFSINGVCFSSWEWNIEHWPLASQHGSTEWNHLRQCCTAYSPCLQCMYIWLHFHVPPKCLLKFAHNFSEHLHVPKTFLICDCPV